MMLENLFSFWQYLILLNIAMGLIVIVVFLVHLISKENRDIVIEMEPAFDLVREFRTELVRDGLIDKPNPLVLLYQLLIPGYISYKAGCFLIDIAKFGIAGALNKVIIAAVEELNKVNLGYGQYFGELAEMEEDSETEDINETEDTTK